MPLQPLDNSFLEMDIWEAEVFWSKVDKSGDCWLWTGGKTKKGYGRHKLRNNQVYTHRIAYYEKHFELDLSLTLDHLCRNTACCNPDHLEAVTQSENNRRAPKHIVHGDFSYSRPKQPEPLAKTCPSCHRQQDKSFYYPASWLKSGYCKKCSNAKSIISRRKKT